MPTRTEVLARVLSAHTLVNPCTELPKRQETVEEWIKVKWLQEQLETIPGVRKGGSEAHQQQRVSILDMIRVRLSQHETAEEEHFWPAVRQDLDGGDELADAALSQEQEGKDLLQALMGVPGGEDRFDDLVEKLVVALRKHVAFEDTVLMKFEEKVSAEACQDLGRKFLQAFEGAPTRPYPHAPNEGGALQMAARAAAPTDHARDRAGGGRQVERAQPLPPELAEECGLEHQGWATIITAGNCIEARVMVTPP